MPETKVAIRAFEMADWEDVAKIFLAPRCQQCTMQMPYQSRDEIKKKLSDPPPNFHRLVAVLDGTCKVIGMVSLHLSKGRCAHVGGLGMFVHDDHQGQGIGSRLMEAALDVAESWCNLTRIELTVYTDNLPAIDLYEKFGFVIEGTLRKYAFRNGTYVDAYTMARVKEEN